MEINSSTSLRINGERGRTIKNLKKAAARISAAIKNKENIILYGDADLDGVTALIILEETIRNLGGELPVVYFPDREKEGYGISEIGLNYFKKISPALLIVLDLGIGNFEEVKLAKKFGFKVLIIDHHEILDRLPGAEIIVNPKQKGDKYPFKNFATVGIVFKLSEFLLKKNLTENLRKNFLELTALATIADMMPRKGENQIFIEDGLKSIENSWRPGIQALFNEEQFKNYSNLNQKVSKIISLLNVRDVENNLPASFRLLTSPDLEKSKKLIGKLIEKSKIRRQKIEETIQEIEERINRRAQPIIFEGDSLWDFTLISSVASIICRRHQKPTFIYKIIKDESQGTVRVPAGIDSVALMKKCSKYPIIYGGHPSASGFRIKNENLEKFKECLISRFKQ